MRLDIGDQLLERRAFHQREQFSERWYGIVIGVVLLAQCLVLGIGPKGVAALWARSQLSLISPTDLRRRPPGSLPVTSAMPPSIYSAPPARFSVRR
jgi:hypothetical protein